MKADIKEEKMSILPLLSLVLNKRNWNAHSMAIFSFYSRQHGAPERSAAHRDRRIERSDEPRAQPHLLRPGDPAGHRLLQGAGTPEDCRLPARVQKEGQHVIRSGMIVSVTTVCKTWLIDWCAEQCCVSGRLLSGSGSDLEVHIRIRILIKK